jgi:hypothetical protein
LAPVRRDPPAPRSLARRLLFPPGVNLATETSVEFDLDPSGPAAPSRPCPDTRVRFRLRNVYVPSPVELLDLLYGDTLLEGVVIARSRNVTGGDQVVIRVEGLGVLLVVPDRALEPSERAQPTAPETQR